MPELKCTCGASCWASERENEPCWGTVYHDKYGMTHIHYCNGHGHPYDHLPYLKQSDFDAGNYDPLAYWHLKS